MAIDYSLLKFGKGAHDPKRARKAKQAPVTRTVREEVFWRERNTCRAWRDGHRFPWCKQIATQLHEGKTRGAGGKVSTTNSVALCDGCHEKRHGVGAWLRIIVRDANLPNGVTFIRRTPKERAA